MIDGIELELRRELWMWRGLMVVLLIILTLTTLATYLKDREQHSFDNEERARAWTTIIGNQKSIEEMLNYNYTTTLKVDTSLNRCMGCHSYVTKPKKAK